MVNFDLFQKLCEDRAYELLQKQVGYSIEISYKGIPLVRDYIDPNWHICFDEESPDVLVLGFLGSESEFCIHKTEVIDIDYAVVDGEVWEITVQMENGIKYWFGMAGEY